MIHKGILAIEISLATIILYSCKNRDSNLISELPHSEKEKSYVHVKMFSGNGNVLSTAQINEFSFTVTVKCPNFINNGREFSETLTVTNSDVIPVVTDKICFLTFDSFEKGLNGDKVFRPHQEGTKLILEYTGTTHKKILKSSTPGDYVDSLSSFTHKYVNGSGEGNSLKLYVSSSPVQDITLTIPTTEIDVSLHNIDPPPPFPLKLTKIIRTVGSQPYLQYGFSSLANPKKTSWPANCKVIPKDKIQSYSWPDINQAYKNSSNSINCSEISLTSYNDWESRKGQEQIIILAETPKDFEQNSYRLIRIPAHIN